MEVKHGRLQLGKLDGRDADGPDITQVVVASLPLDRGNLWSHPVRCPDERLPLAQRGGDLKVKRDE